MQHDKPFTDRVERALEIYASIAACNQYLSQGSGVHALTAALMLPCYRAEFERLARQLSHAEENALVSGLQRLWPKPVAGDASESPGSCCSRPAGPAAA